MIFAPVLLSGVVRVMPRQILAVRACAAAKRAAKGLNVAVVIPARDEAEHIGHTLRSLLARHWGGDLRVVVVDNSSADATGAIARDLAAQDERLRVLAGEPLEPGWSGKMWAVSQGRRSRRSWLRIMCWLTDADIVHGPGHVALLVAHAEDGGNGLVSEMVRLRCDDLAEWATLPAFVFFFQMLYPFRWVNDPKSERLRLQAARCWFHGAAMRSVDRCQPDSRGTD